MEKEIQVAVEWWAHQLAGKPNHDNGEALHNMLANAASAALPPVTDEQLQAFKENLTAKLKEEFARDWKPENPDFGSYMRALHLSVDYDPSRVLYESADEAGIRAILRFPVKTTMWVNPGEVKVACGYRAAPETLLQEGE